MRTRIKICGFTDPREVGQALDLGVDYIGINLACGPRRVSIHHARQLRQSVGAMAQAVALFVDADVQTVLNDCAVSGCSIAQLHGAESPNEVAYLARRLQVIKALRIRSKADLDAAVAYADAGVSALLLDAFVPGQAGGSGVTWDHRLLSAWSAPAPIFLAGGLASENVQTALALSAAQVVDVASGVEWAPGRKCQRRMAALVAAVREYDDTRQLPHRLPLSARSGSH